MEEIDAAAKAYITHYSVEGLYIYIYIYYNSMQPISFSLAVETITYGQHIPKPFVQSRKGQQRPLSGL